MFLEPEDLKARRIKVCFTQWYKGKVYKFLWKLTHFEYRSKVPYWNEAREKQVLYVPYHVMLNKNIYFLSIQIVLLLIIHSFSTTKIMLLLFFTLKTTLFPPHESFTFFSLFFYASWAFFVLEFGLVPKIINHFLWNILQHNFLLLYANPPKKSLLYSPDPSKCLGRHKNFHFPVRGLCSLFIHLLLATLFSCITLVILWSLHLIVLTCMTKLIPRWRMS